VPRWFQSVEVLPHEAPFSAALMRELGLGGIHCGSARNIHPGCLNTDLLRIGERDGRTTERGRLALVDDSIYFLEHDSTEPYPVEDGAFEWAYSEHFIEHLTLDEAIAWLQEIRRVLAPGGLVRVSTPSLALYLRGYVDPKHEFFVERREVMRGMRVFREREIPERDAWMVNNLFYQWDHQWLYDFDELRHVLVEAGFDPASAVERGFRESAIPAAGALDLEGRAYQSVYAEARTPG
jgi:predicted SAM-dependent methyltransferase